MKAQHLRLLIKRYRHSSLGNFSQYPIRSLFRKVLRDVEKQMAPELPVQLNRQITLVGVLATSDKTLSATIGVIDETNLEGKTKMRQRMAKFL